MKIERISDNQIRCTLNKSDLLDREIKISELAYGTEKAQELFKDMMQQASFEFGFEVNDVPLMIEAIPLSTDSIMLIITKVDDPDDLDAKFANLASNIKKFKKKESQKNDLLEATPDTTNVSDKKYYVKSDNYFCIYSFTNLDEISSLAKQFDSKYTGINSLYKNNKSNIYYLVIHKSSEDTTPFDTFLSIASEYGSKENATYATESSYIEHYETIIKDKAIQVLYTL